MAIDLEETHKAYCQMDGSIRFEHKDRDTNLPFLLMKCGVALLPLLLPLKHSLCLSQSTFSVSQ